VIEFKLWFDWLLVLVDKYAKIH